MAGTAEARKAAAYWRARARAHLDWVQNFRVSETDEDLHRAEAAFCLANAERVERKGGAGR